MRTLTFPKGGIQPFDRKKATRGVPARNAIIPRTSVVPLLQHTGVPAVARVQSGDRVREGMLIGRAEHRTSAAVHAPTPGVVREIRRIRLPDGRQTDAIVIDMDGEFDRLGKRIPAQDWEQLDGPAILRLLRENGVVGMGDSPLPVHLDFAESVVGLCETLIVNGAESEPYLSADHRVMVEHAAAVLTGARILARTVQAPELVVAVEANKPDALSAMQRAAAGLEDRVRFVRLRVKYPQSDERQLIKAVTGREVPSGGTAVDVRMLTVNVATAKAVHDAVVHRQPLIDRILTVGGGAIAEPANIKARIGTPIADLIRECGGFASIPAKVVVGGPLLGHTVTDLETPVTKFTRGILALTDREVRKAPRSPCIQCGRCLEACPMGLDPARLFKLIDHSKTEAAVGEGLFDCTECGSCGYICPSRIPLVEGLRLGKATVRRKTGE